MFINFEIKFIINIFSILELLYVIYRDTENKHILCAFSFLS